MSKRAYLMNFTAVALAGSLLSSPAFAQTGEESVGLDEIVVTSQKRASNVQDVPIAITAISSELLENTQIVSFDSLQQLAPSLSFNTGASDRDGKIAIRGFGTSGRNNELDPAVGIFVDGIFMDRTGNGVGDFIDIERVEVLRGPQGTLFGKNTPAGLINFITKPATFEHEVEARLTLGNYDLTRVQGTASGAIIGDVVAGRISAYSHERDGFFENAITGTALRDRNRWGVRGKLLFELSDDLDIVLSADYNEEDEVGPGGVCLSGSLCVNSPPPFDRVVEHNKDGFTEATRYGGFAEINYQIGEYTFTSLTGYRNYEYFRDQDADFSATALLNVLSSNPQQEHWTQEFRLASPTDKSYDYIIGAYFFDKSLDNDLVTLLGPGFAPILADQGENRLSSFENTAYAAFAHGNYRLANDTINLFAGLRYTNEEKEQNDSATITPFAGFAGFQANPGTQAFFEDDVITWTVGAQKFFENDSMIYATIATGFKSGGTTATRLRDLNLTTSTGTDRQTLIDAGVVFESETSTNYEVGFKSQFLDNKARFNIAAFYTDVQDYQASQFNSVNNQFFLRNAGEVSLKGIELDGVYQPDDFWTFTGALAYTDSQYDDFQNAQPNAVQANAGDTVQDLSGRTIDNAPKWTGSLTARYQRPVTDQTDLFVQVEAYHRSSVFLNVDLDPNLVQDAYTLANVKIGFERDHLFGSLFVNNLFEEDYLLSGGDIFRTNDSYYGIPGDPRTAGAQLGFRY